MTIQAHIFYIIASHAPTIKVQTDRIRLKNAPSIWHLYLLLNFGACLVNDLPVFCAAMRRWCGLILWCLFTSLTQGNPYFNISLAADAHELSQLIDQSNHLGAFGGITREAGTLFGLNIDATFVATVLATFRLMLSSNEISLISSLTGRLPAMKLFSSWMSTTMPTTAVSLGGWANAT